MLGIIDTMTIGDPIPKLSIIPYNINPILTSSMLLFLPIIAGQHLKARLATYIKIPNKC